MKVLRYLGILAIAIVLQSCRAVSSGAAVSAATSGSAFGYGRAYFHPTRIAPYRFRNTTIRLHFDFARGVVYGDETVVLVPKRSGLRELPFNSVGIAYDSITVDGKSASYSQDPDELINVRLGSLSVANVPLTLRFRYSAVPKRGVYFVHPDRAYPDIAPEIWTQGEPTDNRRWFPTWDEPNEKTPSELIITVPRGWTAVANGYLAPHTQTSSDETFDWKSPKPKSTYLISFAAGPLVEHHTTLGSLNVDSFVQPRYADRNALCFDRTKDMTAYFQRIIGVPFPWEKYDQTTAERYDFGGMEDVSATLLTDLALHPASEEPENSCDILIAHELAQQWWGDDATMSDWSNVWLHEGFATYFDELWSGQRSGENEFEFRRYQAQQTYFQETEQYLRPIVDYVYSDPLDVFDASSHERPAQVLHMLRVMLGDARFFGATRSYLLKFAFRNADTNEFFTAIDAYLGTDLTWFKGEWFYRSDYPHYYVRDHYDAPSRTLTLDVKQRNAGERPYRMPIRIEAYFGHSHAGIYPVIDRNQQTVVIRNVPRAPDMVLFDPNDNVLKQLTFAKSVRELAYQLTNAPYVGNREWALQQLASQVHAKSVMRMQALLAVRRAATRDSFYGVRSDAMAVAAAFRDAAAVHDGLHDSDKRVRLAAESAAAALQGAPANIISDLNAMAGNPDPNVVAAALSSLGALRAPRVYSRLITALSVTSFGETVASGALNGLAAYGDPRALPPIEALTVYGTPEQERDAAVVAVAQLAKATKQPDAALDTLENLLLHDRLSSTRIAAAGALETLGDIRSLSALQRAQNDDSQVVVRDAAASAVMAIQGSPHQ